MVDTFSIHNLLSCISTNEFILCSIVFFANSSTIDETAITTVTIIIFIKNVYSLLKLSSESITSLGINIEATDFIIPAGTKNNDKINPNLL